MEKQSLTQANCLCENKQNAEKLFAPIISNRIFFFFFGVRFLDLCSISHFRLVAPMDQNDKTMANASILRWIAAC